jgi:L-gulonolactone oxidase
MYRLRGRLSGRSRVHYAPFFYPLDGLANWNRLYGRTGLYQWQGVIPHESATKGLLELLKKVTESRQCSPLSVLKVFGTRPSPGLLSFPMPGVTLAVDLQNQGPRTVALVRELNAIAIAHGGRIYPAKDAFMSIEEFRAGYPQWQDFMHHRDPGFTSNFARRVGIDRL